MWLMTKHGFYSIVQKQPGEFHIRARVRKDLENLVTRVLLTNLMRRGILPYRKIGRFVRLDPVECDRAMDKFKHRGLLDNEVSQLGSVGAQM